jgi:hypothetical protein
MEGIYRITFDDLANAGIPISGIDPRNIQIFAANQEIPLHIEGESDGIFNVGDYIEFIGRPNDGRLETTLYQDPGDQPNPDYSLFNDTLHHFLTWNNNTDNLRYEAVSGSIDAFTPQPYVWKKLKRVYINNYYQGLLDAQGVSLPIYTEGEGWMSPRFGFSGSSSNPILDTDFNTSGLYTGEGAPDGEAESISAGVSNASPGLGNNHHLQIRYGQSNILAVNFQFQGYQVNRFTFPLPHESIGATTTRIRHEVPNTLGVASDYQAVASVSLTFPHTTSLGGLSSFLFEYRLNPNSSVTRFDFSGITGANPRIYTRSGSPQRFELDSEGDVWRALVANSFGDERFDCFLVTDESILSVNSITPIVNNGFFTNFGIADVDSAFIIIPHSSLIEAAQEYSLYRQQRFNTVLVDVAELYDQFGGGVEKSGLAIRNFANYLLNTWPTAPQYLLLLGKSVRDAPEGNSPGFRRNGVIYERNLVPTLGYPPTDNLLTAGLGATILEPALRTGRISANDPQELLDYLEKLQTFESQPPAAWMKNILHFGGGRDSQEQNRFATYLNNYEEIIEDSAFGGDVHTFLKTSSVPIEINESEAVANLINGGCSMMTFFGHASSDGFDQTIDDPGNYEWNGKYPFLLGNGCYTGDFHSPGFNSTSENYTLLPQKGVIGFLSSVKLGFEASLNDYSRKFYRQLSLLK